MVNLADLDTSFLVPCKHCGELLPEGERLCPICGKVQSVADAADARPEIEPERGFSGEAETRVPMAVESAALPRQEAQAAIGPSFQPSAANEAMHAGVGLVRPGAYWQQEVLGEGGPAHWAGSSLARKRWLIGIAAALVVLLLLAVVHDHFYVDREAGKLQEFRANVEQVRSALSRGDLSAAERGLDALHADHANAPDVQELRQAFDRRVREQAAERGQLSDEAPKAAKAPAPAEPAVPPARAPRPRQAPVVATPAPAMDVADPKEKKECNEALAALALCPNR